MGVFLSYMVAEIAAIPLLRALIYIKIKDCMTKKKPDEKKSVYTNITYVEEKSKKTSKINEISLKTIKIVSISMIFSKFRQISSILLTSKF